MEQAVEQAGILYDIAMSIGASFDLHQMLHVVLETMVEKLDCLAGEVVFFDEVENVVTGFQRVCAVPPGSGSLYVFQQAEQRLQDSVLNRTRGTFADIFPMQGQTPDDEYFYVLALPGRGAVLLAKQSSALTEDWLCALTPPLRKLNKTIDIWLKTQALSEAHQQLQQTHAIASATVEELLSAVSHELRTPLTLIMGFIETILDGRPGPLTEIQQRFLQNSYDSADRLLKLVDNLLTVTYLQKGSIKLEQRQLYPNQMLQNVQNDIMAEAQGKSLSLTLQNEWTSDSLCVGDQHWLTQTILYLVDNAIKFTPAGRQVCIHSRQKNNYWVFEVSDTGMGIPDADLPFVFDGFYRGRNAKTAQIQGLGLGLCVCKAVIEAHGGQIGIKSELNQGTKVWFALPVVQWSQPPVAEAN